MEDFLGAKILKRCTVFQIWACALLLKNRSRESDKFCESTTLNLLRVHFELFAETCISLTNEVFKVDPSKMETFDAVMNYLVGLSTVSIHSRSNVNVGLDFFEMKGFLEASNNLSYIFRLIHLALTSTNYIFVKKVTSEIYAIHIKAQTVSSYQRNVSLVKQLWVAEVVGQENVGGVSAEKKVIHSLAKLTLLANVEAKKTITTSLDKCTEFRLRRDGHSVRLRHSNSNNSTNLNQLLTQELEVNFEKQVEEMRKKGYNYINAKDAIESTNICMKELRKCSPTIRQVLPDIFIGRATMPFEDSAYMLVTKDLIIYSLTPFDCINFELLLSLDLSQYGFLQVAMVLLLFLDPIASDDGACPEPSKMHEMACKLLGIKFDLPKERDYSKLTGLYNQLIAAGRGKMVNWFRTPLTEHGGGPVGATLNIISHIFKSINLINVMKLLGVFITAYDKGLSILESFSLLNDLMGTSEKTNNMKRMCNNIARYLQSVAVMEVKTRNVDLSLCYHIDLEVLPDEGKNDDDIDDDNNDNIDRSINYRKSNNEDISYDKNYNEECKNTCIEENNDNDIQLDTDSNSK